DLGGLQAGFIGVEGLDGGRDQSAHIAPLFSGVYRLSWIVPSCPYVFIIVRALAILLVFFPAVLAADLVLSKARRGIENRYNNAKTVKLQFEQTYSVQGRGRRTESGVLQLRKPGKMRWDYVTPAGKLYLSDGKDIYFYSPSANRVEKTKIKEADDL